MPGGGYVNVGPLYDGHFVFYDAMPEDVCLKLAPGMIQRIDGLIVNNAWVMGRGMSDPDAMPTPAQVVAACAGAGLDAFQVYFIFED